MPNVVTVLALLLMLPAAASAQDLDTVVSSVVRISGMRGETPVRGSGFVVALDRDKATIVTASHVIEGVQQLEVTFAVDSTTGFPAGAVLGMESGNQRGLAVFQVRGALPTGVTTLSFETEVQLQRGEDLFLIGFPQMARVPLTLRRTFAGRDGNVLQLDLPSGEGFSGAPVLRKSKVLGVVTDEDPQLTFAVRASVVKDAVLGWGVRLDGQSRASMTRPSKQTRQVPTEGTAVAPQAIYNAAYNDYLTGNFDSAMHGFQRYLLVSPASDLTDNAAYWIGEIYYRQRHYHEAIKQFDEVLNRYPRGDKIASALLKKGYAYLELGERSNGVLQLQLVINRYSLSDEANLARQRLRELGVNP